MVRASSPFLIAPVLAGALLLGACSGSGEQSDENAPSAKTESRSGGSAEKSEASAKGDCDLLDLGALSAAFNNKLTFTKMDGHGQRGSGCTVSIAQGQGGQLIFQVEKAESFAARKEAYKKQRSVPITGIGKEALLINDAQLIAIDDQDRAISLGLQLITFDGAPPITKEEAASAIEQIGRDVMKKL